MKLFKMLLFGCLLTLFTVKVCARSQVKYKEDKTAFPNPERGWFLFLELKPSYQTNKNNWATPELLDKYFAKGYRIGKHITKIPTNSEPIPQDYLDKL